jgi:type IV secretory pathway VirB9-like protein
MVPNKRADMLFVEPATTLSHSNMTVITDRHHYYFDLVSGASEACSRGAVIYSLRLHDPTTTPDTLLQPTAWRHP